MGPNVKFVSFIGGPVSERKNGGKFSYPEKDHTGGAGPMGIWSKTIKHTFFLAPFPYLVFWLS